MVLLIALFLWGCGSKGSDPPEASSNPSSSRYPKKGESKSRRSMPRPISYTVSAVGSLKTLEDVTISPKKAGIIQKIFVKEGDQVKKGQILVQLDDVDARLQVEMAEARMKEAEASLETDRITLARYQKLLETKVISQQTYDDLNLKVKLDEARLALGQGRTESGQTEPFGPSNCLSHRRRHESQNCCPGRPCECGPER